ncbi:MAG: RCC1 domain-containing protein [Nannocystaceae bacterium]
MYPDAQGSPSVVPLRSKAIGLAMDSFVACSVGHEGAVECWTAKEQVALGPEPETILIGAGSVTDPSVIEGVDDAIMVSIESGTACILHRTGEVSCWGKNSWGQAGSGFELFSTDFVEISVPDP